MKTGEKFDVQSISRDKVLLILKWCENKFGKSTHYKRFPKLRVYKSKGTANPDYRGTGLLGEFHNETIKIFLGSHTSVRQLCRTVIHEYKHYLMGLKEFYQLYGKFVKKGKNLDYIEDHHPHEIKAERFEKRWTDLCFKELKNKLYGKQG